ncbi:hypothetical protein GCM10023157_15400 [Gluconacetobacter asukensis]
MMIAGMESVRVPAALGGLPYSGRWIGFSAHTHDAGLGAVYAFAHDQVYRTADLQAIKPVVGHAMAMEIDLSPVMRRNKAVIRLGDEPGNVAFQPEGLVVLDLGSADADMVFQLPDGSVERIPHGDMGIFMCMILRPFAPDDDVASWHGDDQFHTIELALTMVPVGDLDRHVASLDIVLEPRQK